MEAGATSHPALKSDSGADEGLESTLAEDDDTCTDTVCSLDGFKVADALVGGPADRGNADVGRQLQSSYGGEADVE